jgi:hypothetical protein
MRCLYCGNELALLKKLTGHGEFCSEAHRQKYQEQYNRLALTRLLQAQDTEAERRPLQVSARPGSASRGSLNAGLEAKQLPSAAPPRVPPRVSDYPDLSGFLPHQFEPALSPAELFSSEPFLAAVTACLPSAAAPATRFAISTGELSSYPQDPGNGRDAVVDTPERRVFSSLRLLGGSASVPLSLQRIDSLPIRDEAAQGYVFHPEFDQTIASLLTLMDELASSGRPPLPPLVSAPVTALGTNGRSSYRTVEPAAGAGVSKEADTGLVPASETPELAVEERAEAAPDDLLFEDAGRMAGAHAMSSMEKSAPAVVVNLDVLTREFWGPLSSRSPAETVAVVVGDSEEARRLLGWPEEEIPASVPETAQDVGNEAVQVAAEPNEESREPEFDEAEPVTPEAAIEALAPPVLERVAEPFAETSVPLAEADRSAPRQMIPAVCLEFIEVHLELADDAFAPIADSEFAGPEFQIQTPAITTAPLRAKVVFGPNPESPERPAVAAVAAIEEMEAAPDASGSDVLPRTEPRGETAAPVPELFDAAQRGRRFEDTVVPGAPPPPVAGAAQTAARLRSMAALARKAQQDLAGPEPALEPAAPAVEPSRTVNEPPPAPIREDSGLDSLRLEMERMGAPMPGSSSLSRRIAVILGLLLAALLVGYLMKQAFASKPAPKAQFSRLEAYGPTIGSGDTGWSLDWAGQKNEGGIPGRQIYIFRPSLSMSDYRIEFKGQIEAKGLGWVFRAANPRNYYLMKLEMAQAGLEPKVMVSRTAVINGEETQKSRAELPMRVRLDTVYSVRTDVFGTTFRTYIQDQLVDTWVDDRLKSGGFGLVRDAGELSQVRLIQLQGLRLVTQ